MRLVAVLLSLALVCTTSFGCSSIKGYPKYFSTYNERFLEQINGDIFGETASNDSKCNKESLCARFFDCIKENSAVDKRDCRDRIVGELMVFIDLQYNAFRADLYRENVAGKFAGNFIGIGLGTAGVLSGTTEAKNTLAALSAGIAGVQASFDKAVLFEMTMPAIIEQMDNTRKSMRDEIYAHIKNDDPASYPLSRAITDINAYFLAGTLPGAINALIKSTAAQGTAKKADLTSKMIDLYALVLKQTVEVKKSILSKMTIDMLSLSADQKSLLKTCYKLDFGSQPTDITDVSGALLYLLSTITDDETYAKVDKVVTEAIKPAKEAKPKKS
jgi:hypothetical protein